MKQDNSLIIRELEDYLQKEENLSEEDKHIIISAIKLLKGKNEKK